MKKEKPFVPTEFHISTVADDKGPFGILSVRTTGGRLEIALDSEATVALLDAVARLQAKINERR
ncbi:MAG: hypothetical protein EOS18_29070 [Mesorhizobium sp.]|nr:MAG: hypothetical protein EOS18_29070 [Mesorhizobium sp.]